MIAGLERCDGGANLVDDADAFMTQYAAGLTRWQIAFEDVEIGAANRRLRNFDDRIGRKGDFRLWPIFQGLLAHGLIHQRLHHWGCCRF